MTNEEYLKSLKGKKLAICFQMFVSCGRCPNYENCNPSIPCEDNLLRFFESEASVLPKKVEEEEKQISIYNELPV